ncbi:MAG: 16S rRNA (guanine(527)-N(7))-methyltransferase RsmG, partial [Vulcanococcus sp.]
AEYLVPLLKPAGQALLYRGQWGAADQSELERALQLLRAEIVRCDQRDLPGERGQRTALFVASSAPCPKSYPRAVGMPSKFPLGQTGSPL